MQANPLLEQLDWFFTSNAWTISYPNSVVNPLARPISISDHVPCVVTIGTSIAKAAVFRFENYWTKLPGFAEKVQMIWNINCPGNSATRISAKFKLLRKALKLWASNQSTLKKLIENCNEVILSLDEIEELRILHISNGTSGILSRNICNIFYHASKNIGSSVVLNAGLN
jgi:hypothetical protein